MSESHDKGGDLPAGEETVTNTTGETEEVVPAGAFSQADLDRIVGERVQRERAKYADYDDLKAKASEAKTVEDRLGELETVLARERATALRTSVAARFGISTESDDDGPSDAELFLTGGDEATLTAQAERLAARASERSTQSNYVPREGSNPRPSPDGRQQFADFLTGNLS